MAGGPSGTSRPEKKSPSTTPIAEIIHSSAESPVMLLVKTYLDKSPISGIGLFAAEPIEEGTLVWKLSNLDIVIHEQDLKAMNLTDLQMHFMETFPYKNGNT